MGRIRSLFAAWLMLLALAAPAVAQTYPDRGRAAVVDAANIIPDTEEALLAMRLVAWQRQTGHQLVVATVPDLQGYTIAQYANGLLRHWRLGRAGENDGILLLLANRERRVRIEVGYGLEPVLTDVQTNRIIRETIRPALQAYDYGPALFDGAERIIAEVGEPPAAAATPAPATAAPARFVDRPHPDDEGPSVASVLFWSFLPAGLIVLFIVWLYRRNRPALPDGPVRPLSKRAERRRQQRAAAAAARSVTWDGGTAFAHSQFSSDSSSSSSSWSSSDSSWSSSDSYSSSSDSGGFDGGGGSSGGGGSDSSY